MSIFFSKSLFTKIKAHRHIVYVWLSPFAVHLKLSQHCLLIHYESESGSACPILCDPMDYTVHGMLRARILEWEPFPSPGDLPNPGIEPRSPALQVDSLPAEPQGKPKNTGVGSLYLLQWIFLTQELKWDLLNCRRILYQLSYQGSPVNRLYPNTK